METDETPTPAPDFAQVLADLKAEYKVNDSEIARRIGVSPATVNTWVHRKRVPRVDAVRALAEAFPKFSLKQLSEAAGRKAPGPVSPDREARVLEYFRNLTEAQQELTEIQLKALNEANRG